MNIKDAFLGFIGRIAPGLLSMSRPARVQRPILQTVEPKNRLLMPYERPRLRPLVRIEPKVGRNEPCTCGSGAKFKKCCG